MTFGALDHALVVLLAIATPLFGVWTYRRMIARLAAGDVGARTRGYRKAIGLDLGAGAVILVLWAVSGRPVERLVSLAWLPEGWWTGVAWGLVLLACAGLIAQVAAIRGNETGLSTARKQMASLEGFLPHTPGELKLFFGVSLAAGIGEEIVFRGYLLNYFDGLLGSAGAVIASTLMFGLGHAYQGAAGVVRTGIVGLLMAGAYVGTGSLLAPVLLHVVIDVTSGMVAYLALRPVTAVGALPA